MSSTRCRSALCLGVVLALTVGRDAHAYIDPGTGGTVFSSLAPILGILAVVFLATLRFTWVYVRAALLFLWRHRLWCALLLAVVVLAAAQVCVQLSGDMQPKPAAPPLAGATVAEDMGGVLEPSAAGSDSWGIGMGAAAKTAEGVILIYSGAAERNEEEKSVKWLPHLAVSRDAGRTWEKRGPVLAMPQGCVMMTPESLVRYEGRLYLFYHTQRRGARFADAWGWAIGAAESADGRNWRDLGEIVRASDFGLAGALTNPSVVIAQGGCYMAVSQWLGPHKYGIRLLRAGSLLGPYEDLGLVVDPDHAQQPWYGHGAWDAELFEHRGVYYILFGGQDSPEPSSFRHYGLAVSKGIRGPYAVFEEPFFSTREAQIGGRCALIPNDDGTVTAILDMWTAGYKRVGVRALRLTLPAPADAGAPPAKPGDVATRPAEESQERLRAAQRRESQMRAQRDTGTRPADPFRLFGPEEWPATERHKYELRNQVRNSFVFRLSGVCEKEVTPKRGERLVFAVAADFPPGGDPHDSVEFRLVAGAVQADGPLFASEWEACGGAPGWREGSVDLTPFVGHPVPLRFEVSLRSNSGRQKPGPLFLIGEPRLVGPAVRRQPNVLLCIIETVRRDHLSLYGYGRVTTPFLEHLAAEALVFEEGWAQSSSTRASVASILTGLYPSQHGTRLTLDRLDGSLRTLPEMLREQGYVTAGFFTNELISRPAFNHDQGFDVFTDEGAGLGEKVRQDMFAWLDAEEERPFCAVLHFFDPHEPYVAPGRYCECFAGDYGGPLTAVESLIPRTLRMMRGLTPADVEYVKARYDGELRYADVVVERLVRGLKARGLWDDTLLVITADHGEEFLDHGDWGHGTNLYPEKLRVPLLIKPPGPGTGGRRIAGLASGVDIMPTVLTATGLGVPHELPGIDLLGSAGAVGATRRTQHLAEYYGRYDWDPVYHALTQGRYQYILSQGPDGTTHEELFDLADDPAARHNLAGEQPAVRDRLGAALRALRQETGERPSGSGAPADLDEDTLRSLKELGYL